MIACMVCERLYGIFFLHKLLNRIDSLVLSPSTTLSQFHGCEHILDIIPSEPIEFSLFIARLVVVFNKRKHFYWQNQKSKKNHWNQKQSCNVAVSSETINKEAINFCLSTCYTEPFIFRLWSHHPTKFPVYIFKATVHLQSRCKPAGFHIKIPADGNF